MWNLGTGRLSDLPTGMQGAVEEQEGEKQAGLSPDPGRPYILAECMLASCQRVICEL